jgi:hypothetical protein
VFVKKTNRILIFHVFHAVLSHLGAAGAWCRVGPNDLGS